MNAEVNRSFPSPAVAVQALVAEYGAIRVALALAGLVARRRPDAARVSDADLSDRMRSDIGLDPLPLARDWREF